MKAVVMFKFKKDGSQTRLELYPENANEKKLLDIWYSMNSDYPVQDSVITFDEGEEPD